MSLLAVCKQERTIDDFLKPTVQIIDAESFATHFSLERGHANCSISCLSFSNDARHLATGATDFLVCVWSFCDGTLKSKLQHTGDIRSTEFNMHGDKLLSLADNTLVYVWDWERETILSNFVVLTCANAMSTNKSLLCYNMDSSLIKHVFVSSVDLILCRFDEAGSNMKKSSEKSIIFTFSISPNFRVCRLRGCCVISHNIYGVIVFNGISGGMLLFDDSTDTLLHSVFVEGMINDLCFSADGLRVATCQEKLVQVREVATGNLFNEFTLPRGYGSILGVSFSPCGFRMACCFGKGDLCYCVVDLASGETVHVCEASDRRGESHIEYCPMVIVLM